MRRLGQSNPFTSVLRSRWAFALVSAVVTLLCARSFYRSMWYQTGGAWSAPLDDVFIHLDFARQTARGAFLEWAPGNGYSSGATSPLYALVLAAGYRLGARGGALLVVAALLAMAACWTALLGYRRGYVALGRGTAALLGLPFLFYAVGAADWAFWSGMEVALFVGLHGVVFAAWCRHAARGRAPSSRAVWGFGVSCILLVATRPEALVTVFWFAVALACCTHGHRVRTLIASAAPSAGFVYGLSLVNYWQTGDSLAYGALVKLAWYNPTLSLADKWLDYQENLEHVLRAVFQTHVGSVPHACSVLFALAVLALGDRPRRKATLLLWAQCVSWFLLVSLNGQVRWQNERYAMPAVAWLLVLSAFGVAGARRAPRWSWIAATLAGLGSFFASAVPDVFVRRARWPYPFDADEPRLPHALGMLGDVGRFLRDVPVVWYWAGGFVLLATLAVCSRTGRGLALAAAALVLADATEPNLRTQRWFFGRASKNILEQQSTLGAWLRESGGAKRGRVLVGDAGAILYASDWKGLDLIGLGGYHDVPFARAGALGLGAQLELLERLPETDRPDLLAIFPSWWESLPLFFTSAVVKRFPIQGNVICGDFEHVLYRADWSLLRSGTQPRMLAGDLRVIDVLDTGDLVSERSHHYEYGPTRKNGKVTFKILGDGSDTSLEADDMLDAGRRLAMGSFERFVLRGAAPGARAYVLVRTAPEGVQEYRLTVRGQGMETRTLPIRLEETGSFVETPFVLEPPIAAEVEIQVEALGLGDYVGYHVYFAQ